MIRTSTQKHFLTGNIKMRNIFIDGGANIGQSTAKFLAEWPNSDNFEIFMFEPNSDTSKIKSSIKDNEKIKFFNKALWINNGEVSFYEKTPNSQGNTLSMNKVARDSSTFKKRSVPCIDLSEWITKSFTNKDYIILKLDVEGAEYELVDKMIEDKSFDYVDIFFCEIHGLKCGKTLLQSIELIDKCEQEGKKVFAWDAETFDYRNYKDLVYNKKMLEASYKKWKNRGLW